MSSLDTLTLILNVALQLWLLSYLWQLKDCDCAFEWRRTYIFGHIVTITILNILDYITQSTLFSNVYVLVIMLFANIIYIIIVVTYVLHLKSCLCATDIRKGILLVVSIMQAIIFATTLVLVLWEIHQWRKIQISKPSKNGVDEVAVETIEAPEYVPVPRKQQAMSWLSGYLPNNNNLTKMKIAALVLVASIVVVLGLIAMMYIDKRLKPRSPGLT